MPGPLHGLCDGDDWWCDPFKLQRQVEELKSDAACGLCYTRSERRFEAAGFGLLVKKWLRRRPKR